MITRAQAKEHASHIVLQAFTAATKRNLSMSDMAREMGIGDRVSTVHKWKCGTLPRADMYVLLEAWLTIQPK